MIIIIMIMFVYCLYNFFVDIPTLYIIISFYNAEMEPFLFNLIQKLVSLTICYRNFQ